MVKVIAFSFLALLLGLFYLSLYNMDHVRVMVSKETFYDLPKFALMAVSLCAGALFMFYIFFLRDAKRFFQSQRLTRIKKKQDKMEGYYNKALHYLVSKRLDEASSEFTNALKENPGHIPSLLKLGDMAMEKGNSTEASGYYQKAWILNENNMESLLKMAQVKEAAGSLEEALEYTEKILAIEPDNLVALYKKRDLYEKLSRWEELIQLQKRIIKITGADKNNKGAQERIALGYEYESARQSLENGELDKAGKAFKGIIKTDRDFIPAYLGLAEVLISEGATGEAAGYLQKSFGQTGSLILLVRLEDLLIGLEDPSRLLAMYRGFVGARPDDERIKFFMGKLFYRLEMLDDALDLFNSLEASCFYPVIHKLKGGIHLRRNQYEPAAEEFLKIIDMKEALIIPYTCSSCKHESVEWTGRCPSCKEWNTYQFNVQRVCTI